MNAREHYGLVAVTLSVLSLALAHTTAIPITSLVGAGIAVLTALAAQRAFLGRVPRCTRYAHWSVGIPGIVWAIVIAALLASAGCIGDAAVGVRQGTDTGAAAVHECPPSEAERRAIDQACIAFAASTPATVAANLAGVTRAMETILAGQQWIRGRFGWFAIHRIEAVFTVCGIDDERSAALLRTMATAARDDATLRVVLREESLSFCRGASRYPAAVAGSAWSPAARLAWEGRCLRLLDPTVATVAATTIATGTVTATASHASVVVVHGATEGSARDVHPCEVLSWKRDGMANRTLSRMEWIEFGRKLSLCASERAPWEILHLEGGREEFVQRYASPFITGDLIRGRLFQNTAPDLHRAIIAAYADD